MTTRPDRPLTDADRAIYEWQMWVPGFGEEGQRRLKNASVFVSRVGGVGGTVAYQLAAAGVGRLVLAHAGNVRPDDLNRQLLMTHDWVGRPRMESSRAGTAWAWSAPQQPASRRTAGRSDMGHLPHDTRIGQVAPPR